MDSTVPNEMPYNATTYTDAHSFSPTHILICQNIHSTTLFFPIEQTLVISKPYLITKVFLYFQYGLSELL